MSTMTLQENATKPAPATAAGGRTTTTSGDGTASKKVFIKTFGCQMNVYDSERMTEALEADGYDATDSLDDADLVILNTCHIREKAAEKVYSDLGRIRKVKEQRASLGQDTVITVAGCVAQAEGLEMVRRAPLVDLVIGPQSYHRLPQLIARLARGEKNLVETDFPEKDKFSGLPARSIAGGKAAINGAVSAFLTIQEGCDKFCSFCVVPYTRGAEYSRSVAEIETELERLIQRGTKEVTLLGQNVNAYHGVGPESKPWSLAKLLRRLARLDGIERLRYTTSHPHDMDDDLIAVHGEVSKVMPYLHLPFQAGSDRILAAMNRKHTRDDYISLIQQIRAARPDIAMSTDIIVGFPGESDEDFEKTLEVVRSVTFAQAYSFKYSARPGTPAAKSAGQVPDEVKTERLARLQLLLASQQKAFNEAMVGRTVPVLFERKGRQPGWLAGRTPYLQIVHAEASDSRLGELIPVEIQSASSNSLSGVVATG